MELTDAIHQRRSVRNYKGNILSRKNILQILEHAIWAPTASNMQAWKFIIIDEPELITQIKTFSQGLFGNPPAIIITCIDMIKARKKAGKAADLGLAYYDAALVSQNISLLALEFGLGTCLINSYHKGALKKLLKLPEEITPHLIISIGYPRTTPIKAPPRVPITEIVSWNIHEEGE